MSVLNWFKKQLNKLFDSDIEDEQYYEELDYEDENSNSYTKEISNVEQQDHTKRSSFRFPLIADNEMELSKPIQPSGEVNKREFLNDRLAEKSTDYPKNFYQQNAISKVYEVEVSGIRELLEKRQRIKGYSNVLSHNTTKIRKVEKPKTVERVKKEVVVKQKYDVKVKTEEINNQVGNRRFIPTEVPSPVYGFKRPSDINDLLIKKQDDKQYSDEENKIESESSIEAMPFKMNNSAPDVPELFKAAEEIASTVQIGGEIATSAESIQKDEGLASSHTTVHLVEESANPIGNIPSETVVDNVNLIESIQQPTEIPKLIEVVQMTEEITSSVESIQAVEEVLGAVKITQAEEGNSSEVESTQPATEIASSIETNHLMDEKLTTHIEITEIKNEDFEQHSNDSFIDIDEEVEQQQPSVLPNEFYKRIEEVAISTEEVMEVPQDIQEFTRNQNEFTDTATTVSEEHEQEQVINEEVEEKAQENEQSKGSKLPFNVLMLKSDKEKYAVKLAQKEQQQHNDDIKEISRHPFNPSLENSIEQTETVNNHEMTSNGSYLETNTDPSFVEQSSMLENIQVQQEQPTELHVTETIEKAPPKIYVKPSLEFLSPPEEKTEDRDWMESQADILVEALSYFQVTAQVESIMQGPAVTQFEITVGHGTKVSKIRNLADDLKLALAAKDIRIQAPIPGKSSIGIEIPNRISRAVRLSEITSSDSFVDSESPLEAALGLDLTGKPVTLDLRKMPHGLIAGATGSGKSVCINSILVSLLYKADPHELKLMLIDPKMVELAPFNHIPHLVSPVITDVKAATAALKWAVEEMERRYQLFAHAGVRDLPRFNKLAEQNGEYGHKLPYILIVIDELADLMMMSPADVEEAICRIAQKARACGIHLIVATQRPSVDVITGLIKSNIPTRIAFAVSSQVDSRTILDSQGAERLLGRGDMLYLGNGMSDPIRLQGTFVTDDEIEEIIDHVREQGDPDYIFEQDELLRKTEMIEETDELFEEVCRFVYEQGTASTSSIQRKYHIGYNRAARLIDMLESQGFISEQRGSKPREVFITDTDLTSMFE